LATEAQRHGGTEGRKRGDKEMEKKEIAKKEAI
jgi:hypothetical protein